MELRSESDCERRDIITARQSNERQSAVKERGKEAYSYDVRQSCFEIYTATNQRQRVAVFGTPIQVQTSYMCESVGSSNNRGVFSPSHKDNAAANLPFVTSLRNEKI